MATLKTECSELSVAFGLLGHLALILPRYEDIVPEFEGSLSEAKFSAFQRTYISDGMYASMNDVGLQLRKAYIPFNDLRSLRWTGGDRQAKTMSTAKDLLAANIPISVKAESRVVGNPSPYNLFVATPQGSAQAQGMTSWYLETAPSEYEEFYKQARRTVASANGVAALPSDVADFERSHHKRTLVNAVRGIDPTEAPAFQEAYLSLCRKVSQVSADRFNAHLATSLASRTRSTVLERIAKMFFRMNAVEYVLCGIDGNNKFAVVIPDLTTWLQTWQFENIKAIAEPAKEQSIVSFEILCKQKTGTETYRAKFHAEIRWSHGKFSSVEGKLYKQFDWESVPFFRRLI